MHSNRWWSKRVIRRKDQGSPVLSVLIGCFWGTRQDVMPSVCLSDVEMIEAKVLL